MIGVFAGWISAHYGRAWYRGRWFVAALGFIILAAMYASLWHITDHRLEWSADSYFARIFRFNLVSLGFAMLLPLASSWQLGVKALPRPRSDACSLCFTSFTFHFSKSWRN